MYILYYLFIIYILLLEIKSQFREDRSHNIGTVLLARHDIEMKCWTRYQIALLNSRKILQNILPEEGSINFCDDRYVKEVLTYFKKAVKAAKKDSCGETKDILMKAIADIIGGYLHHYLLPMTKRAFYAGFVDYYKSKKLYDLYDELKIFLKTDGSGWMKPEINRKYLDNCRITPLVIKPSSTYHNPCKNIIMFSSSKADGSIIIPLPYLDDRTTPGAIALPFKDIPLHSITTADSVNLLQKFYIAVTQCSLKKKGCNCAEKAWLKFNKKFYNWIHREVLPNLDNDVLYPAFGGVQRLLLTLQRYMQNKHKCKTKKTVHKTKKRSNDSTYIGNAVSKIKNASTVREYVIILLVCAAAIWILLLCFCCCKHIKQKVYTKFSDRNKYDKHTRKVKNNHKLYHRPTNGMWFRKSDRYHKLKESNNDNFVKGIEDFLAVDNSFSEISEKDYLTHVASCSDRSIKKDNLENNAIKMVENNTTHSNVTKPQLFVPNFPLVTKLGENKSTNINLELKPLIHMKKPSADIGRRSKLLGKSKPNENCKLTQTKDIPLIDKDNTCCISKVRTYTKIPIAKSSETNQTSKEIICQAAFEEYIPTSKAVIPALLESSENLSVVSEVISTSESFQTEDSRKSPISQSKSRSRILRDLEWLKKLKSKDKKSGEESFRLIPEKKDEKSKYISTKKSFQKLVKKKSRSN